MIGSRNSQLAGLGFVAGIACGALAWSQVQRHYRRDLFSKHPLRRFAALSHLRTRSSMSTLRLLREYVAWERTPALRQRAVKLMHEIEATLA